jgi:hypothetical protein
MPVVLGSCVAAAVLLSAFLVWRNRRLKSQVERLENRASASIRRVFITSCGCINVDVIAQKTARANSHKRYTIKHCRL